MWQESSSVAVMPSRLEPKATVRAMSHLREASRFRAAPETTAAEIGAIESPHHVLDRLVRTATRVPSKFVNLTRFWSLAKWRWSMPALHNARVLRVRAGRPRERLRASRELPASAGS